MSSTPATPRGLPRWLLVLLGVALVGFSIHSWAPTVSGLRQVLTPIFFAFMIAYLLDPLVDRLEARKVPRALGILILLAGLLLAGAVFLLLLLPGVIREVLAFVHELPSKLRAVGRGIEPLAERYDLVLPHTMNEVIELVQGLGGGESASVPTAEIAGRAATMLSAVGRWALGGTASAVSVIASLLIVPVLAFYLLHDFDPMTRGIRDLVPHRYRPFVVDVAMEVDQVLGQFVRGQLLVMLLLAILYAVAYSICGVRLAVPIGIVAGILSFIPYVGGASALVLALLMCLLSWQSWWQVGAVVVSYTVIQVLEGFVITPRIVGDKVGLPPVWVLVALMVGGELFGFLGVLLALPAAAVGKIFVVRAVAAYRKSKLYTEGGHPEAFPALAMVLGQEGLPDTAAVADAKQASGAGGGGVAAAAAETEAETEAATETEAETEAEAETETETETETEAEAEAENATETDGAGPPRSTRDE